MSRKCSEPAIPARSTPRSTACWKNLREENAHAVGQLHMQRYGTKRRPTMALLSTTGGIGVVPREVATAMTGLEFLEKLRNGVLPAPPFAEETDIWITEVEPGRVVFEAKPSPRFLNPLGRPRRLDLNRARFRHGLRGAFHSRGRAGLHQLRHERELRTAGLRQDRRAPL